MTESQKYDAVREARSAWLDVRGVRYHLLEWGELTSPLLMMLHGWGDCAASFQFVVDELKEDWFVVAPDWRGFGRSHHRCDSYWFPDYLADLDVLLEHYQPQKPVNLLGHSMGANIAGLYAGVFPDRVLNFVNVEGFGLADSHPANAPANYRRWLSRIRTMPAYSTYSSFELLADRIISRAPEMSIDKALFVAHEWACADASGEIVLRADPAHKLPNAVQYRRAEAMACWENVSAPVLLVVGENSDFTAAAKSFIDPDSAAHPFRNNLSVTIPGCGHMVHFERPRELALEVDRFLLGRSSSIV
ncbi:MAG: alpha/beta fold hydrolase [Woeseiaceae bacterium]